MFFKEIERQIAQSHLKNMLGFNNIDYEALYVQIAFEKHVEINNKYEALSIQFHLKYMEKLSERIFSYG